ncbi:hypothetical protein Sfulv_11300 [Streptomyces fulvorobeus]|uniref:FHA domain-containing protein n=1 Tax=Streptomyces fulvorobeus TaxID=284028 RepID=A0A7J0C1D0_9ACTN|nr:hypothetical protein Sfulv_11300 [Streptomyces fulvorobeus]
MVDDARVSWRHATISWSGRGWSIEDHGSTNGTYVQGQRIHQMEIGPGSAVHLGNATDGPRLRLSAAAGLYSGQAAGAQQAPAHPGQGAPAGPGPMQPPQQQAWQPPQPQQGPVQPQVPHQTGVPNTPGPGGPGGVPRAGRSTGTAAPPRSTSSTSAG